MKYLIAGLGNIGPRYEITRHNIGFLTLDRLAGQHNQSFQSDRLADRCLLQHKGKRFVLIKPTTFMNLSGKAVHYWLQKEKLSPQRLLVVTDDIALPFGNLRMRARGSSAGHNGLQNIEEVLGTREYARLKMGIGNDFPKGGQVDYVLSPFPEDQLKALPEHMDRAGEMILSFGIAGVDRTMSRFND